jgi:hypothetical protein
MLENVFVFVIEYVCAVLLATWLNGISMDLYASGWCLSLGVIFERAKVLYRMQLVIAIWIDQYQSY